MKIVVVGGSRLIGTKLVNRLRRGSSLRRSRHISMELETGSSAQRRDVMDGLKGKHQEAGHLSLRRARPLTRTQEVLFIASALGVGVALQMFVLLYAGSI
jgi:hypothetical protein